MLNCRPARTLTTAAALLACVVLGKPLASSSFGHYFIFGRTQLILLMAGYRFIASVLPLWVLLVALSLFAFGLGTTFPISVVSIQNSVHRSQVGTITGAMNFFRALMASFTVAAFTAILLMALGAEVSVVGEQHGMVSGIAPADVVTAFRYVFAAAAALMAAATLLMMLMEEMPLAGPATVPVEMAE